MSTISATFTAGQSKDFHGGHSYQVITGDDLTIEEYHTENQPMDRSLYEGVSAEFIVVKHKEKRFNKLRVTSPTSQDVKIVIVDGGAGSL